MGSLRTICTCERTYASTYNSGYSSSLTALGPPTSGNVSATAAGLADNSLASGIMSGYRFTYAPTADSTGCNNRFTVIAEPVTVGETGSEYYFMDETCIIRRNLTRQASAADSPLEGFTQSGEWTFDRGPWRPCAR